MCATHRPNHETCITHMLKKKLCLLNRFCCMHCDKSNLVRQDQASAGPEDEWRQDNSNSMHSSNLPTNSESFFLITFLAHYIDLFLHTCDQTKRDSCDLTFYL